MKEQLFNLISEKAPGAQPLLIAIRGSHAYGTSLPSSDVDYVGVYIQSLDDILGFGYKEQISDEKNDIVFYEIKRFLELLEVNNPNIMELLSTPEDCIVYKHPLFNEILCHKNDFITKISAKSFAGYAHSQISKAKGQDKKQNWEKEKVIRKDVLDFVYVIDEGVSIPWKEWNSGRYEEKFIGATNISNARDVYALYYDHDAFICFSDSQPEYMRENAKKWRRESGKPMGFGYKGLIKVSEDENSPESNQLRLSSIPKGEKPIANIIYNKDGYTMHCKDYNSYQEWLSKRNDQRWIDVQSHGQKIDGKNMMHCRRLLEMAREIAQGKGVNVRRPNVDYLLSIRKGDVDLQTLIDNAENDIKEINELFKSSNLRDNVDKNLINSLLVNIRKNFYKI